MKLTLRESWNGWTHISGAVVFLIAAVILIRDSAAHASPRHTMCFCIYGVTLVALYATSGLYHSLRMPAHKIDMLRQLDHAMIYLLIAGTYTPLCLIVLKGAWGTTLLAVNWTLAGIGFALKLLFRYPPRWAIVVFFVFFILMGWLIVVAWVPLVRVLPAAGVYWLVLGGLFYSSGAVILNLNHLKNAGSFGAHEIWHFYVMAGSFCHFWLMWRYIRFID